MIEPSEPRLIPSSATTLDVYWRSIVQGVPVKHYVIQYRKLGQRKNKWETVEGVIPANMNSSRVTQLKSGEWSKYEWVASV